MGRARTDSEARELKTISTFFEPTAAVHFKKPSKLVYRVKNLVTAHVPGSLVHIYARCMRGRGSTSRCKIL
jgi:hypothetical protein